MRKILAKNLIWLFLFCFILALSLPFIYLLNYKNIKTESITNFFEKEEYELFFQNLEKKELIEIKENPFLKLD